jgi:methylmalonyl-CoA mutase cobalamin-binding domain/chain
MGRRIVMSLMEEYPSFTQALQDALLNGDETTTIEVTKEILSLGIDPVALIQEVVVPSLTEVGRRFATMEIFLPELMESGAAGRAASELIEAELAKTGTVVEPLGVVVLGTVKGDIHDIGKNITASLFKAHGFKVIDLGKDVPAARFLEAAETNRADIIGASALMSITRAGCRDVATLLEDSGVRDKYIYIVGGGSIDQTYANEIRADGFGDTATEGIEVAKMLIEKKKGVTECSQPIAY